MQFISSEDSTEIKTPKELDAVARLLRVTESDLSAALTARVIAARGEVMQKTHTTNQAETGRDALAKVCYNFLHMHSIYCTIFLNLMKKQSFSKINKEIILLLFFISGCI